MRIETLNKGRYFQSLCSGCSWEIRARDSAGGIAVAINAIGAAAKHCRVYARIEFS
jgi:hypothetical protein